jgi:hypothetical protein
LATAFPPAFTISSTTTSAAYVSFFDTLFFCPASLVLNPRSLTTTAAPREAKNKEYALPRPILVKQTSSCSSDYNDSVIKSKLRHEKEKVGDVMAGLVMSLCSHENKRVFT